jgi:predicted transcriptional regulator
MHTVVVKLDDDTFKALSRIAPAAKRRREAFMRQAVKDALLRQEFAQMREAYLKQPDAGAEADDWANCEQFEA